jgi:hypothetical protein
MKGNFLVIVILDILILNVNFTIKVIKSLGNVLFISDMNYPIEIMYIIHHKNHLNIYVINR